MKKIKINDNLAINAIRLLSVCAISKAKSGHPGIALGAAPIMYELFANQMNISPIDHNYFNRDRFVLSCGHASSLLYATMLICGYDNITMDDLKNFRQINSKTPGHPEPATLKNVEVCTGPLGQGIAMAVGFAIANKKIANQVNLPKLDVINNYTYCLFGDGCFEEGISYEAIAIAGRLKLNKLIMIYDYNQVQLDGKVSDSTIIKTKKYFKSMGWNVIECNDKTNQIHNAINNAKKSSKPNIILCHTTLGYGTDVANSNKAHGTPLTEDQIAKLKENIHYTYNDFEIPNELDLLPNLITDRVKKEIENFDKKMIKLQNENIEKYDFLLKIMEQKHLVFKYDWFKTIKFPEKDATRNIAGNVLQTIVENNSNLIALIADLASSTKIKIENSSFIDSDNWNGQNLNCGVREFAMAAIGNGITTYGGLKSIGSTFLSFSDYNKAAIRLAAISKIPSINIFSHDSITVGEDGPTHQPIEQLWTLRLIPNHLVFRPTSYIDMIVAFEYAINSKQTPISIITSRSAFKQINVDYELAKKGGYVVYNSKKTSHVLTIFATGSEIELAIQVASKLPYSTRVVAINSLEILLQQNKKYIDSIFDKSKKISIEFSITTPWYKYVDLAIGIDCFGCSAKPNDVIKNFNLSCDQIVDKIKKWYKK